MTREFVLILLKLGHRFQNGTCTYSFKDGNYFLWNEIGLRNWIVIDEKDVPTGDPELKLQLKPNVKVHTTIGVYPNWDGLGDNGYKINGVDPVDLQGHIVYNLNYRFGRALFLDGKCIYQGGISDVAVTFWEKLIQDNPGKFTKQEVTKPYE